MSDIIGTPIGDVLDGTVLDDLFDGLAGDDTMNGLEGDDTFLGDAGADAHFGGTGTDTVDYSAATSRVIVNLFTGVGAKGDAKGDSYDSIETIIGSDYGDRLLGDARIGVELYADLGTTSCA